MHRLPRLALFLLGWSVVVSPGLQKSSSPAGSQAILSNLKALHAEASLGVIQGKKTDPLPSGLGKKFQSTVQPGPGQKTPANFQELLGATEDALAQLGAKVTVEVNSAPDSCDVTYRPIAGGGFTEFGVTQHKDTVEPRTYEFVCKCTPASSSSKIVDCTEDKTIDFECRH